MILKQLRDATRDQHEALEAVLPLGEAALNPALYDRLLGRFWGFYATWEAEAARAAEPKLQRTLTQRRKLPLLERDLAARNGSAVGLPVMPPEKLPRFSQGEPVLLGSMYVVEGATLGGQVISRGLERQGFHDGIGYSFFRSYGQAAGQQWKAFVALLEEVPDEHAQVAVEAAKATFDAFAEWFAEGGFAEKIV